MELVHEGFDKGFRGLREDLLKFLGDDFGLADGDFTSLVAMLLIRLGLDDGTLISNPNWVLDGSEVTLVQERTNALNEIIADCAASIGAPVVDIHSFFEAAAAAPPVFQGVPLTPSFNGGLFSLDGVQPGLNFIFSVDPFIDKDGDGRVLRRTWTKCPIALETLLFALR